MTSLVPGWIIFRHGQKRFFILRKLLSVKALSAAATKGSALKTGTKRKEDETMKKHVLIGLAGLLALTVSCMREPQEPILAGDSLMLTARTEKPVESRTVVESGALVFWEPGDEIAVFFGENRRRFVTNITEPSGRAVFWGTLGEEAWSEGQDLWAIYPYSEEASFDGETITTVLPSEQFARAGSFGKDMNLSIACSTTASLQFYNVGGGICFSITEEGVKKVMFEGLDGEMISGKVRVGFEEGLPKVQEVVEGSRFITLLPPVGQETFQKDTQYFIVAIPGSLEKGYKLRFYKDEDYAKRVSEKAVTIQRSIFGVIDRADEGIEYEAQMTHFPETEDDWEESIALTEETTDEIGRIVFSDNENNTVDKLIDAVEKVDGVISAEVNSDASVMMVLQRDSVWINVLLKEYLCPEVIEAETEPMNAPLLAAHKANVASYNNRGEVSSIIKEDSFFPKRDSALVFAPFEDTGDNVDEWVSILSRLFKKVRVLKGDKASIEYCKEEVLSRYDYIIFSTHGIDGYYLQDKWLFDFEHMRHGYCLCTGTRYTLGGPVAKQLANEGFRPEEICVTLRKDLKRYMGLTAQFFQKKLFQDKVIILSACSSAFNYYNSSENDPNGSIMRALLNNNARLVVGTKDSVYPVVSGMLNKYLLLYMEHGLSFQTAFEYIQHSGMAQNAIDEFNVWVPFEVDGKPDPEPFHWDIGNNYMYVPNPKTQNEPYFLVDPFPNSLKDDDAVGGSANTRVLSWDCNLNTFPIIWYDSIYLDDLTGKLRWKMKEYTYPVHYDVYVKYGDKEVLAGPELILKTTKWTAPGPGTYSWYVVAKILDGDKVIASYRSGDSSFSIKEQKPDAPVVETFPASVDVGKVFLSAMVTNRSLEGLETGFHYYKMTAGDEASQLSVSDSLRLVLSGKTVRSAGDYKDYFGIDLTDITPDSKYLFAAFATDGYGQTGRGRVLSFKVGSSTIHVQSVSLNRTQLDLTVGSKATLVATVLPENATNKSVSWSSSNASKASVSSTGVVMAVAAGTATITVTTTDGGKTATCKVTVREASPPEPEPEPRLSVSTRRLDFGNQTKFTQKSRDITITNSGTGTLNISSITKTSNYGDLFQLSGWTSGGSIAAGASKTVTVSFQPIEERTYEETLTIVSSNAVGDKRVTVSLSGTGASEPEDARIQVSVDELSWGNVEIGESVTKSFTVKNIGSTALTIGSIKVVATDNTVDPPYFTVSPNSSLTLSPGKSRSFNITFAPNSVRQFNAMLSIKSNATNATQGTSTVWLTGNGVGATSKVLTASPSSLSFGMQTVGNRTHKNFTVYNKGTKAVTLYSITASDGFVVTSSWTEGSNLGMAAGSSKTFSIEFRPTQLRSYSGALTIKSNASTGDLVIPLSGTGVEAQGYLEITSGDRLDFGSVNVGASGTLTTRIRNTGEARLTILGVSCPEGFTAECNASSIKEGYNSSVTVSFTPTAPRTYSGSVIVYTDAENESISIDVSGRGIPSSSSSTFVDMGLSVKWASANVGAANPEEYGHYVAWGETSTKRQYLYSNYKYFDADSYFSDHGFIKKYCSNSDYGYNGYYDSLRMLTYEDDYANVKLGGLARIPTRKEWEELKKNCTWLWTTVNGVKGYQVTSNINGNSIFLPAGGWIEYSNKELNEVGYYWSADLHHYSWYGDTWELRSNKAWYSSRERYMGMSVRAVEDYSARPMIDTQPASLRFERVKLGTTASQQVTIYNIGKGTLHISEIRSTKRIAFDWTTASIEPGASKILTVYYTPKEDPHLVISDPETWDMTTMTIASDASNDSEYTMYITGYGVANTGDIEGTEEDPWN